MPKSVPLRKVRESSRKDRQNKGRKMAVENPDTNTNNSESGSCTLGIDIGSHRSRACLWTSSGAKVVQNEHSYGILGTSFPGEFPSEVYVFDPPPAPLYLVDREDPSRQSVSAKYVFYVLANAEDKILEQYPPVHSLTTKKDDVEFRARLRQAVIELLCVLRDRTMEMCSDEGLRITKVGLTIPVQWTLDFEYVYRGLVAEVFSIDPETIFFFTETEALARYLYKFHGPKLDPKDEYSTLMFVDYGGHNMNGCLFGVARDVDDPMGNGFFRIGKPFGAGGGSEQWDHHIASWLSTLWYENFKAPLPPRHLEEFLHKFRPQKAKEANSREPITRTFPLPGACDWFELTLSVEHINQAWRKAILRPLSVVAREMQRLAEMAKTEPERVPRPVVVVSGGTARNPAVKSYMKDLEKEHGIPVVFTDGYVGITYNSAKVAMAASYVVSETLTVEQFFARGVAIGLQMRQTPLQGKPREPVRDWDCRGDVLLTHPSQPGLPWPKSQASFSVELAVRYWDEFRLICDPFCDPTLDLLPAEDDEDRLFVQALRSYDLLYLGKRKQGTWKFHLSLVGSGGDVKLVLKQWYKQRMEHPWTVMKTLHLPLYFDGNSGCVQVGARDKTIAELNLGLPRQPDEMEGEGGESSDYDSDIEELESEPVSFLTRRGTKPQCSLIRAQAYIPT